MVKLLVANGCDDANILKLCLIPWRRSSYRCFCIGTGLRKHDAPADL